VGEPCEDCWTRRDRNRPTAPALDYAHGQGVVHGHLCPDFVWLADNRLVKIAGFGFAKAYNEMAWPPHSATWSQGS
jgi:serine/threonine protein kinase